VSWRVGSTSATYAVENGNPKTDSISYEGKDKDGKTGEVTTNVQATGGQERHRCENFLNDQYWLFVPVQ